MTAKASTAGSAQARALLFLGESSLVDPVVDQAIARVLPGQARSLNLEVFRHGERALEDVIAALRQVGMFAAERCVWIRGGVPRAKPRAAGKAAEPGGDDEGEEEEVRTGDLADDLLRLVEGGLPPATTLLVSAPSLDARSKAYKWFARNGEVRDLRVEIGKKGRPDAERLRHLVEERLVAAGVRDIGPGAVEEIIRRSGNNFGELLQEIDRLCTGLSDGARLRVSDVRTAMRDQASTWVFDLSDALGARRLADAERLVERLLAQGEVPLRLVSFVGNHVADLLEARQALSLLPRGAMSMQGEQFIRGPLSDLPESFRRGRNGWRLFFLLKAAANFTAADLVAIHREVLGLDLALKGSRTSPLLLFSRFLHRVCPV